MEFQLPTLKLFIIINIFLWLTACGGGGGSTTNTTPPGSDPFAPVAQAILYFTSTFRLNSGSTVNTTVNQYVPETNESLPVAFNQSFSFARSSIAVHTFDDRLVTVRNSGDVSGFGGGTWNDIDINADKDLSAISFPISAQVLTTEGSSQPNCVAVSSSTIYWKSPEIDGGLKATSFNSTQNSETLLISSTQPEACQTALFTGGNAGGMDFADGVWYSTRFDLTSGLMDFFVRDPVTAQTTPLASFTPVDHAQYDQRYTFGFDNSFVYWARVNPTLNELEVWRFDFIAPPQLLLIASVTGFTLQGVTQLDVDDGIVVFRIFEGTDPSGFDSHIVLFDSADITTTEVIDLLDIVPAVGGLQPPSFGNLQVMFRTP